MATPVEHGSRNLFPHIPIPRETLAVLRVYQNLKPAANFIREIIFNKEQPKDTRYGIAVGGGFLAVSAALVVAVQNILNPQSPSIIRNLITLIERTQ